MIFEYNIEIFFLYNSHSVLVFEKLLCFFEKKLLLYIEFYLYMYSLQCVRSEHDAMVNA